MVIKKDIHEYDIKQCDANVMYEFGLIDEHKYIELINMDKKKRVITVGIMRRDSKLDTDYHNAIKTCVELFKEKNELTEQDVYEIAKDAVWVHRHVLHTKFRNRIEFVLKNTATVMYVFNNIKFYYNEDDGSFFTRGLGGKENRICDIVKQALVYYCAGDKRRLYIYIHNNKLAYHRHTLDKEFYIPLHGDKEDINIKLLDDLVESLI